MGLHRDSVSHCHSILQTGILSDDRNSVMNCMGLLASVLRCLELNPGVRYNCLFHSRFSDRCTLFSFLSSHWLLSYDAHLNVTSSAPFIGILCRSTELRINWQGGESREKGTGASRVQGTVLFISRQSRRTNTPFTSKQERGWTAARVSRPQRFTEGRTR